MSCKKESATRTQENGNDLDSSKIGAIKIEIDPSFLRNGIVAHRGAWREFKLPQNSLAALEQAIKIGCEASEFDVHITQDDSLVINHDALYNGINIETNKYAAIANQKLANGENLPLLRSFLSAIVLQEKTRLLLEIKPSTVDKSRTLRSVDKIYEMVKSMNASKWVIYASFDYDAIVKMHRLSPASQVEYLSTNKTPGQLVDAGITGMYYNYSFLFPDKANWVTNAKLYGLSVDTWTVNDTISYRTCLNAGLTRIVTDRPKYFLSFN